MTYELTRVVSAYSAVVGPIGQPAASDVDALAALVSPYVYVTQQPIMLYNWHSASNDSDLNTSAQDSKAYVSFQKMTGSYWAHVNDGRSDDFGTGLYASVDPVATLDFGGNSGKWILTQMRVGSGFRILDLNVDGERQVPPSQSDLISRLGCPKELATAPFLNWIMQPANTAAYPKCQMARR
jgi:hypothetical protein